MRVIIKYFLINVCLMSFASEKAENIEENIFSTIGINQKERQEYTEFIFNELINRNDGPLLNVLSYLDDKDEPLMRKFSIKRNTYGYTIYIVWYDKIKTRYKIFDEKNVNYVGQLFVYNNVRDADAKSFLLDKIKWIISTLLAAGSTWFFIRFVYSEYKKIAGLVPINDFIDPKKKDLTFTQVFKGFDKKTQQNLQDNFMTPLITKTEDDGVFFPSLFLFGPGGTGKTEIGHVIGDYIVGVSELFTSCVVYMVRPSNLSSSLPLSRTKILTHIFRELISTASSNPNVFYILMFDESEILVLGDQGNGDIVSTFKTEWSNLKKEELGNVGIIVASNLPINVDDASERKLQHTLDSAAVSRFTIIEVLPNTTEEGINDIVNNLLNIRYKNTVLGQCCKQISGLQKKISADIARICKEYIQQFITREEFTEKRMKDGATSLAFAPIDMFTARFIEKNLNVINSQIAQAVYGDRIKAAEKNAKNINEGNMEDVVYLNDIEEKRIPAQKIKEIVEKIFREKCEEIIKKYSDYLKKKK